MQLKTYITFQLLFFAITLILGTVLANIFTTLLNISTLYDAKRFLVITFIWLTVILAFFTKSLKIYLPSKLSMVLIISFFALAIASTLQSKHPYWGVIELTNISLLFVIFMLLKDSLYWLPKEKLVVISFLSVAFFSIFHFVVYLLNLSFYYLESNSIHASSLVVGYDNIRFLNQLQVMLLPILFLPVFYSQLEKYKLYTLLLVSLHWLMLLQTEARGAILSLVTAFSWILFYLSTTKRNLAFSFFFKSVLLGTLLWFVLVLVIPYLIFYHNSLQIRMESSGRIDMWLYAMQEITEKLWLGFGPMSFAWAEGRPQANAHPHNFIVQLVYEYGVIIGLLVVGFIVKFFYRAFETVKLKEEGLTICFLYSIAAAFVYSLFSGITVMPFAQLILTFMLAAFWASTSTPQLEGRELNTSLKCVLILLVTFASIILLGSFEHEALQETGHPRFWLNGAVGF